ncbi:hypothetical protein Tco_0311726 [Tanacetum coccineum]
MASESSLQQTKTQVTSASNLNFECDKVSSASTMTSHSYYYEYLREFWYSAEVDTTYTITFNLSCFDKPLSFNLGDFSSITELKYSENYDTLPLKEMFGLGGLTFGGGVTYPGLGGLTRGGGVKYFGLGGLTFGGGVA